MSETLNPDRLSIEVSDQSEGAVEVPVDVSEALGSIAGQVAEVELQEVQEIDAENVPT